MKDQLSILQIYVKHFIDNESYLFKNVLKNSKIEETLKETLSEAFSVNRDQVMIVGSSKLGFSLNPTKLFQEFDHVFSITGKEKDKSDLDIAIVCPKLFDDLNRRLYMFTKSFRKRWEKNEYYQEVNYFEVPLNYKFFEYHTKGWFRPDMKPLGFEFCSIGNYEQLKGKVIQLTRRKPGIAIYKDKFYFETYHLENLTRIKNSMRKDIL